MKRQANPTLKTVRSEWPVERLGAAPPADSPSTILALIERVALDTRADVEKLDRVMAMYDRLKAKGAELAFNAAKGRILKKLAGIKIVKNRPVLSEIEKGKPQKGTFEAFKYAPLEEIDKHLRPLLAEEMDPSYSDEPWEGGGILIRGRLRHLPSGHYEDSFLPAPLDTTGGKSSVQAVGSTNSFLRHYLACNIFNIVVVGDDEDGTGGTVDEAQTKTVLDLMKRAKVGPKFLKYMRAQSVEQADSLETAAATIAARDYRAKASISLAMELWGDPAFTALIDSRGKLANAQVGEKLHAEIARERSGGVQYWALFDHRNGEFVGCGGLRPWLYAPGEANFEVGFHLVKRCWGKGFRN